LVFLAKPVIGQYDVIEDNGIQSCSEKVQELRKVEESNDIWVQSIYEITALMGLPH
jgi:hypothetical protein